MLRDDVVGFAEIGAQVVKFVSIRQPVVLRADRSVFVLAQWLVRRPEALVDDIEALRVIGFFAQQQSLEADAFNRGKIRILPQRNPEEIGEGGQDVVVHRELIHFAVLFECARPDEERRGSAASFIDVALLAAQIRVVELPLSLFRAYLARLRLCAGYG